MRFLHTADWHIGKKLNGYDLLPDQRYITDQIIQLALTEAVDAVVIAGDLYDRSVPGVEAIQLFNQQIQRLNREAGLPVLAISGNHDSGQRLAVGTDWFATTDFYLHTELAQGLEPVVLGDTQFFLLPYFEPMAAQLYFDEEVKTISEAMKLVVQEMKRRFQPGMKQVLVAHFFAAGSSRSDSETQIEVGGLESVPVDLLGDFDYVALGHLHYVNALKDQRVQYSGAPLKFSVAETQQQKGVFIIDTETFTRSFHPLTPLHDLQILTGAYADLMDPAFYHQAPREDFLQIQLTDRSVIPNLMNQLRQIYPRILGVQRLNGLAKEASYQKFQDRSSSPQVIVADFFTEMTGEELTENQRAWLAEGLQADKQ